MSQESAGRVRMGAAERRSLLLDTAREVFASNGYASVGLAQIADEAAVSKTLLYHYFPNGRPELYREVMARLSDDLASRIRTAVRIPRGAERKIAGAIDAFFGFLADDPAAYRLLFLEPWGTGEPELVGQAMSIRIRIGTEVSQALSASEAPAATTLAASAAAVGSLLHVAEIWLSGQIDRDAAVEAGERFIVGGLESLALVAARPQNR